MEWRGRRQSDNVEDRQGRGGGLGGSPFGRGGGFSLPVGRRSGGLSIGTIIFLVARDQLAGINPQYWYLGIGILLMVVVLFMPKGILGFLARIIDRRN